MTLFDIATFNTFSESDHQISQTFIRICILYQMINVYQLFELIQFVNITSLIVWFMGPTWGPSGADRTQVGPMLAPWTLLSGTPAGNNVNQQPHF